MNSKKIIGLLGVVLAAVFTAGIIHLLLAGVTDGAGLAGFFAFVLVLAIGGYRVGRWNGAEEDQRRPEGWTEEAWRRYQKEQSR